MQVVGIALAAMALLLCAMPAQAQTQLLTFNDLDSRGAISQIMRTLPGCEVTPPRAAGGSISAQIEIDCRNFNASQSPRGGPITVRLFSRMSVAAPWVTQSVVATYRRTGGGGANIFVTRPGPGVAGHTRNLWVELDIYPSTGTWGVVDVTVLAMVPSLPPPLPHCSRSGNSATVFNCNTTADCAPGYRCSPECANTCVWR